MAHCPHCGTPISLLRSASAAPAFPAVCRACGGTFHGTGSFAGIVIAIAGLFVALATVVLSGRQWLGAAVVLVVMLCLVVLARRSRLVASTPSVVRRWRLALIALLLIGLALELLPMVVSQ